MTIVRMDIQEEERLAELDLYEVLDTPNEVEFDALTELAAQICGTPISLVSLIDRNRQWFKSRVGLDASETPREQAFCAYAIQKPGIFSVEDARVDPRFSENPLVTSDPNIRFYAGVPLISPRGHALGTLCVIDRVPRRLTREQENSLRTLARQAASHLELRRTVRELAMTEARLWKSEESHRGLFERSLAGIYRCTVAGEILECNDAFARIFGFENARQTLEEQGQACFFNDVERPAVLARLREFGEIRNFEALLRRRDGSPVWVLKNEALLQKEAGDLAVIEGTLIDISEMKRVAEVLAESEDRFRRLFDDSLGLVCLHDLSGKLLAVNPAAAKQLGYERIEMEERNLADFLSPQARAEFPAYLARYQEEGVTTGMLEIVGRDGAHQAWSYRNALLKAGGKEPVVVAHAIDMTERLRLERQLRKANEALLKLSTLDGLTGIANRRRFDEALMEEWLRAGRLNLRVEWPVSLIFVDVDNFKAFNDRYGHLAGDECLRSVAGFLGETAQRPGDVVARYGGDEFVILMPGTPGDVAERIANRLRERIEAAAIPHEPSPHGVVTASFGVASLRPSIGAQAVTLVERADQALYEAKAAGRNVVGSALESHLPETVS